MLDLLIEGHSDLAQRALYEFKTGRPAQHLRALVKGPAVSDRECAPACARFA